MALAICCPSPLRLLQDMCCTINAHSVVVCGIILPLYIAFHSEEQQRRHFQRAWRRRDMRLGVLGASSGSSEGSLSLNLSTPSNSSLSTLGSNEDADAAVVAAAAAAPLLVLGRRRHARLLQRLQRLQLDPTEAAEREQEAVVELLRRRLPRALRWVVAEAAAVSILAWPLVALAMDSGKGWLCASE